MNYQDQLKEIKPSANYFVGIDSDGCVFDTMEVKQKEFFIPNGIKHFDLFAISKIVRETWEFVNLYSIYRGINRFPALVNVFTLLSKRKDLRDTGFKLPDISSLEEWVRIETKLGNQTLNDYLNVNPDVFLSRVLDWSLAINRDIGTWLKGVRPFTHTIQALEKIKAKADSIVVSQTPLEALEREWKENNIEKFVQLIAGQEHGTKTEHISLAAKGKYQDENILMIGDAPGDMKAAKNNGVCFYPIIPGKEAESWERFNKEAFERFISNSFKGSFEKDLIDEFNNALPEEPHWEVY